MVRGVRMRCPRTARAGRPLLRHPAGLRARLPGRRARQAERGVDLTTSWQRRAHIRWPDDRDLRVRGPAAIAKRTRRLRRPVKIFSSLPVRGESPHLGTAPRRPKRRGRGSRIQLRPERPRTPMPRMRQPHDPQRRNATRVRAQRLRVRGHRRSRGTHCAPNGQAARPHALARPPRHATPAAPSSTRLPAAAPPPRRASSSGSTASPSNATRPTCRSSGSASPSRCSPASRA
jgi:hypothetical protein